MTPEIEVRAARIRLLLMDVDGVLTDGRLFNVPGPDGKMVETKGFDSQDGIALQWLEWYGIHTGVISGRVSPRPRSAPARSRCATSTRVTSKKSRSWRRSIKPSGIALAEIAYAGDDLTDVVVMRRVGLAIATGQRAAEVKRAAHYVTEAPAAAAPCAKWSS